MEPEGLRGLLVQAALAVLVSGCGAHPSWLRGPHVVAQGESPTCPEIRIAAEPGQVEPDGVRCSYADVAGEPASIVAGRVEREQRGSPMGQPIAAMAISLHRFGRAADPYSPGPVLAAATSDEGGRFKLAIRNLSRGDYVLVARERPDRAVLAFVRVSVDGRGGEALSGISLIVPSQPSTIDPANPTVVVVPRGPLPSPRARTFPRATVSEPTPPEGSTSSGSPVEAAPGGPRS